MFDPRWRISKALEHELPLLLNHWQPRSIVETGAGFSTLLLLDWAIAHGADSLHLDHPGKASAALMPQITNGHERVLVSPLRDGFYANCGTERPFDFVLHDGPPGSRSRSGPKAMAFLVARMHARTVAIIDDTHRRSERDVAAVLAAQFGLASRIVLDTEFPPRQSTILEPLNADA